MSDSAARAKWRQVGYRAGLDGAEAKLPENVPDEFAADWWVGFRRGRERAAA